MRTRSKRSFRYSRSDLYITSSLWNLKTKLIRHQIVATEDVDDDILLHSLKSMLRQVKHTYEDDGMQRCHFFSYIASRNYTNLAHLETYHEKHIFILLTLRLLWESYICLANLKTIMRNIYIFILLPSRLLWETYIYLATLETIMRNIYLSCYPRDYYDKHIFILLPSRLLWETYMYLATLETIMRNIYLFATLETIMRNIYLSCDPRDYYEKHIFILLPSRLLW
jgi:hypothetical protein